MNMASKLARIAVVLFSLTLLVAYVWHSHVTPNTPPPDPLGLSTVELELQPEVAKFEGFINHGSPTPSGERPANDLRIISSKVINQPIFSVRKLEPETPEFRVVTADFKLLGLQMVKDLEVVPGIVTTAPQSAGFLLKRQADSLEQPEAIKRVMFDNDSAARNERMMTPEKLWENFHVQMTMMSGSKSGRVFQPSLFNFQRPLLKTDIPLKP